MAKRVILVDADTLLHAASTSAERVIEWGDGNYTRQANLHEAFERFEGEAETIREKLEADRMVMALSDYSDTPRWRNAVLPEYKTNRAGGSKPTVFFPLRERVEAEYECVAKPGLEGDDVLSILATRPRQKSRPIIVSLDKDLRTVPGLLCNYTRAFASGEWEPEEISEDEADLTYHKQMLTGDRVDGVPGCPGVGPVTAEKLLADVPMGQRWAVVLEQYVKKGLTEEYALATARVLRMPRWNEWDPKHKKVRLWTPQEG